MVGVGVVGDEEDVIVWEEKAEDCSQLAVATLRPK